MATAETPQAAAQPKAAREPEVNKLFRMVMKHEASDLHLKVGQPPMMRLRGDIRRMEMRPLTQEDMERLLLPCLNPKQRKILDDEGGVDFSYVIGADECRFRVSLFRQRGRLSLVARRVNNFIPSMKDLGLPDTIEKLCQYSEGLVILAGVTGSGKSTTIAAMLDYVNEREPLHILTVEDPIEFTFTDKKAYINQREIGLDSKDWHKALKYIWTPEDFRLRSGSAGYQAGKDGKDLGADVDLVGPGPAYELWKKTPEYQEWLKVTGQLK